MNNETKANEGNPTKETENGTNKNLRKNNPASESNQEDETNSGKDRMQEITEKAKGYVCEHWKTAAILLGVGIIARFFMNKRDQD